MDALLNALCAGTLAPLAARRLLDRRGVNAATRCALWWGILVSVAALTGASLLPSPPRAASGLHAGEASTQAWWALPAPTLSEQMLAVLAGIWAVGAAALLCRLAWSLRSLLELKRQTRRLPRARIDRLVGSTCAPFRRPPCLALSDRLRTPALLGLWRPIVAVPRRMLERLTDGELDQVLLHELAHLERRDDWAKLVQSVLQSLFWFHPGIWYAARSLDLEREVACDDRVIAKTRAPGSLARCLTRLAEIRSASPSLGVAPGMLASPRALSVRVERLLDDSRNASSTLSTKTLLSVITLCTIAMQGLASFGPFAAPAEIHRHKAADQAPDASKELAGEPAQSAQIREIGSIAGGSPRRDAPASRREVPGLAAQRSTATRARSARRVPPLGAASGAWTIEVARSTPRETLGVDTILSPRSTTASGSLVAGNESRAEWPAARKANGLFEHIARSSLIEPDRNAGTNPYAVIGDGFARAGKRTASFFAGAGLAIGRGFSNVRR